MRKMNVLAGILTVLFLLQSGFVGCATAGPADTRKTEAESTRNAAKEAEASRPNPADGTHEVTYIITGEDTFFNSVSLPFLLPTADWDETLASYGIDPAAPGQLFMTDPVLRCYYSVDLSFAEPLCYTADGALLCKLKNDPDASMILVLDAPNPTMAWYYLSPTWDLSVFDAGFQIDGVPVTDPEEAAYCKELFEIHTQSSGNPQVVLLDGYPTVRAITAVSEQYPGLTYTFYIKEYASREMTVVYSLRDHTFVAAP